MSPFLTVYGHVAIDQILSLVEFPRTNTSVDVLTKRSLYGGTGANLATVAASLGVPTALCSYVGEDFPPGFREFMEGRGVITDELIAVEGYETSAVIIVSDRDHDQVAYVYQGPMADMDTFQPSLGNALASKMVHISTGQPDHYLEVMRKCRSPGRTLAIDPAQEVHRMWDAVRFRAAAEMADIVFANQHELGTMLRYLGAKDVHEMLATVPVIMVTRGRNGSTIHSAEGDVDIPAVLADVVDTTGAGDAFRAGFYAGRYNRMSLRDSAVMGAAAASFVIEAQGGMGKLPTWEGTLDRAAPLL